MEPANAALYSGVFTFFLTQEYIILEHIYNGRNFNKRSFAVQALQHTKKKFEKMLQRRTSKIY
jgi:hypothetical protein